MANLTETGNYDAGVYQIEDGDLVKGGASGIANLQGTALANRTAYLKALLENSAHGECRLVYVSATQIKLQPCDGRNLNIGGVVRQVPSGGVTISNASLAASTVYFVYAWMNGSNMALELSTTTHAQHTNGVEVKSGDTSRTLVGMCRTNGSTQFQSDDAYIGVISFFNRLRKIGKAKFTANRTLTPATGVFSEVNAEIRVYFLTWADEPVRQSICGGWTVSGAATGYGYANIDNDNSGQRAWCAISSSTTGQFSSVDERLVTEGSHFGSLTGNCEGGTNVLWLGGRNGEVSQVLTVMG